MEGKVIFSVLTESHEGSAGDDWKYWIEAKVFNRGLQGQGTISVKKHTFPPGITQEPPGPPPPIEMPAGDYNNQLKVKLTLEATEVDLFKNDVGIVQITVNLDFPEPGAGPTVYDKPVSVGVLESPGLTGEASVFSVMVRLEISC